MSFDPEATACAGGSGGEWVAVEGQEAVAVDAADIIEMRDRRVGTILGSYRLLDLLGEGGMGTVYLAEHVKIGRKVAVKLLRPEYASRPEVVARFFQEAHSVNQIRHENIIDITDFVEDAGGDSYLVMELLSGIDFAQLMRRHWPLPLERVLAIFIQIADGLASAHAAGVVHRDLKPDNVYLVHRGEAKDFVKLLDFGVAKLLGDAMTADYGKGRTVGTPAYMSPEQAAGSAEVDHLADVYAFGAMLYRVCTGKPPFKGKTIQDYVRMHLNDAPRRPNAVEGMPGPLPDRLEALILRCLEKSPSERVQSMEELGEELRVVLSGLAPAPGEGRSAARSRAWRPAWSFVAAAASVVLGAAVAAVFVVNGGQTDDAAAVVIERPLARADRGPERPVAAALESGAPKAIPVSAPARAESRIAFVSDPSGAEVFRADDMRGLPLGVTPFTAPFPREDRDVSFVIRRAGHESGTVRASLREDGAVAVTLERKRPVRALSGSAPKAAPLPGATKAPGGGKRLDVHERLDPFAKP